MEEGLYQALLSIPAGLTAHTMEGVRATTVGDLAESKHLIVSHIIDHALRGRGLFL